MNLAYNTDKRRYIRYELLDFAMMTFEGATEPLNVVVTDIGLGGVQIRMKEQLDPGTKCLLQVTRGDGTPLKLRCEIRHATELPESNLFQAGLRFIPENHQERMMVAEFIHQVFQRHAEELG